MNVLVIGYGNPLAGDDGAGWRAAEALAASPAGARARVLTCRQLTPELAAEAAGAALVIFLDASVEIPPGAVSCQRLEPVAGSGPFSHHLTPGALLTLAERLYGQRPEAVLFSIGARSFSSPNLSPEVENALPPLLEEVQALIERVAQAGQTAAWPACRPQTEDDFFSIMH
ncbi:MAG: hydrogenase maturation protease [Bryobacteraceae bacterium]